MKFSFAIILVIGVISISVGAPAGGLWIVEMEEIVGTGGDQGGFIDAAEFCFTNPDGSKEGSTNIWGSVAGEVVNETMVFSDGCPQIDDNDHATKNPSNTVTFNGVTVTSDCIDQVTMHGVGNNHFKHADRKKEHSVSQLSEHYTETQHSYDGSCVITATNKAGNAETYGAYAYVNAFRESYKVSIKSADSKGGKP